MKSIRNNLRGLKMALDYLEPGRSAPIYPLAQQDAWKTIQLLLQQLNAQVDATEDILNILGLKKEASGDLDMSM